MITDLSAYKTLVFDCDGVVLNSNIIKTEAFYLAAQPWGNAAAEALVAYHISNGGISRHVKFKYFFDSILSEHRPCSTPGRDGPGIDEMLAVFADSVRSGLESCAVANGLEALRSATPQARWLIVSGGDQNELRDIFAERNLFNFFDGGIFGSPDSKDQILAREIETGSISLPAVFLGDSRYDLASARRAGLDFIFVHGWTEIPDWEQFVIEERLCSFESLSDLSAGLPFKKIIPITYH